MLVNRDLPIPLELSDLNGMTEDMAHIPQQHPPAVRLSRMRIIPVLDAGARTLQATRVLYPYR